MRGGGGGGGSSMSGYNYSCLGVDYSCSFSQKRVVEGVGHGGCQSTLLQD